MSEAPRGAFDRGDWTLVRRIFSDALELEPPEREGFIQASCTERPELAAEVRRLLDAHAEAGGFLSEPAASGIPTVSRDGERIGAWRLERLLGLGGMGSVYLARRDDGAFEQAAALKIVKRGMDTDAIVRRFHMERQILARLQHPGIARLIDGGVTDDGLPYFVMEWVDGQPLTVHCEARRLSTRARLRLFLSVCRAVQYAHANLVVHRDLKPSNVLADRDGRVKLLDFGLAKVIEGQGEDEDSGVTVTAPAPFTPEYAAPEQIMGGPITTATDVYALGGVLYELLTGVRPHRSARTMRAGASDEPGFSPPSVALRQARPERARAARQLQGDLDNIVLTALRSEPERRYRSAEALADDLERHLSGRPVNARPASLGYRTRKFIRRNGVAVSAGTLVVLSLSLGLAAATWQAREARRERNAARREAAKAAQVTEFMTSLFQGIDPYRGAEGEVTVRQALDVARQQIGLELADQPEVRAAMLQAMGESYFGLGAQEQAATLFEEALALRLGLFGEMNLDVADTQASLAWLWNERGDLGRSLDYYRRALATRRALLPEQDPEVVSTMNGLGYALRGSSALDESRQVYDEALALGRRVLGVHPEVAVSLNGLAAVLHGQGDFAEAVPIFREALDMTRELQGPDHPNVNIALYNLANALRELGELDEAARYYGEAAELSGRIFGPAHPAHAIDLMGLANVLFETGDDEGAETHYRQALAIQREALPPGHSRTANTLTGLGRLLVETGRFEEAEPLLREALASYRRTADGDDWRSYRVQSLLGATLSGMGRFDEAESWLEHGLEGLERTRGPDDPYTRRALARLQRYRLTPG